MLKKIQNQNKGFTIIETLIVLAIAGLILLIVFLAVPALERTSRNTSRQADISGILSGLSNYVDDNGGVLPTSQSTFDAALFGSGTACSSTTGNVKLGYYSCNNGVNAPGVIFEVAPTAVPAPSQANEPDTVYVITNWTCSSAQTASQTGASARTVAAIYWLETSGAPTAECQAS